MHQPVPSLPDASRRATPRGWVREARLIGYSSGNFGKNLVFAGADLTFLFILTDLLGLSAARAGTLMLFALGGDLVFDLVAAKLVIALRQRGQGYRALLVAGAVPGGAAFAMVYALPWLGRLDTAVLALSLLVFRGSYALIDVPHNALMARVTRDSQARGRVSGYRRFFSTAAALSIAMVLTPRVQQAAHDGAYGRLAMTGIGAGALFAATMIVCALLCEGRGIQGNRAATSHAKSDGIAVPLRDPLLLAMGLIAILTGLTAPAFERMVLYLGTYVLEAPQRVPSLLLALSTGQFAGVFVWTCLTRWIGNPRMLALGHILCALCLALIWATLDCARAMIAGVALLGLAQTCIFMLPWGILADVVDAIEWRHKRRYEAGIFAFFLVVVKASGAAGSVLIGFALDASGYVPHLAAGDRTRSAMILLAIGLPLTGSLLASLVAGRLRLDHAQHARVVEALARRYAK